MSIGARIVMLREQKGLTQYELAEKAHISKSVMNRIELGTRPIRDDELISSSDIKENLTPNTKIIFKEELLIKKYRQLNDDDKEYINDFIDLRLAKQAK